MRLNEALMRLPHNATGADFRTGSINDYVKVMELEQGDDDGARLRRLRQMLDELAEGELVEMGAQLWQQMLLLASLRDVQQPVRGGSRRGKAANKGHDFAAGNRRSMLDYFWPANQQRDSSDSKVPVYNELDFERRFRMPRSVFDKACVGVVRDSSYLRRGLKPDAVGKMGASPLQKVVAALRQLSLGVGADAVDEYTRLGETTALECIKESTRSVTRLFGPLDLREPRAEDLFRIERQFNAVGFPGCNGCLDCGGCDWKNCPKALQGTRVGRSGKANLRMECVSDLDLHIWHLSFAFPGMLNDLNILQLSPLYSKVLAGTFSPIKQTYKVS
jgi:Plant transposon protein